MKRYLVFTWFNVSVLVTALCWLIPLLSGVVCVPFNPVVAVNILLSVDRGMATWMFHTQDRTISGICGERARLGMKGYTLIANMIDWFAQLLGDKTNHCYCVHRKERYRRYILEKYL